MNDFLTFLVEAAIRAPSGENCQPWSFKFDGSKIWLYNLPDRDLSIYNYKQKGSYVSHGAAIENMAIAASSKGYETAVQLFPDQGQPNLMAVLNFEKNETVTADPLVAVIPRRSTNRKFYKPEPLTAEEQDQIIKSCMKVAAPGESLKLITDRKAIIEIAPSLTVNEQLIFSNPVMHQFFFDHLRWTAAEDNEKKNGFFVKALELTFMQVTAFKILKHWSLIKFLDKFGFAKVAGQANLKNYESSGGLGAIVLAGNSNIDYVNAGRMIQRVWLTATSLGLSIQPVTGTLFFMQNIIGGSEDKFSADEITLIKDSYAKIKSVFGIDEETVGMIFRIGKGEPPTAVSLRFAAADFIQ